MRLKQSHVILFIGIVVTAILANNIPRSVTESALTPLKEITTETAPRLSDQKKQHILYGDQTGGGHHHSANRPCKSEFPESWSEDKIVQTVTNLAADQNQSWRQERNGYHVSEFDFENLKIRIVLDREADDIITAYPINVPRNPCPANDNN